MSVGEGPLPDAAAQEAIRESRRARFHAGVALPRLTRKRQQRRPSVFWGIGTETPRLLWFALIVISVTAPFAVWMVVRWLELVEPIFLPTPIDVLRAIPDAFEDAQLPKDTWASFRRIALGFGLSLIVAIPLGLAMGSFRSIRTLFEPAIGFIRYMPATAFVPLLIVWLGIDESPKIAVIFIGTVFFNTLMTANAVWQIPAELIKVSYTLGAGTAAVFRKVIFPYALPGVIDAARVNLAAAWNLIIVAEVLAASDGLGFRIVQAQRFLRIEEIFVMLIAIGVVGLATDIVLRKLRDRLSPWAGA